ncbi:MAG: hypothetical protein M8840_04675 [marine benthic group bacterium]|jgi:hypothetical protein|nr:hypothetical protein [Gemmatimonadota bacterium]
MNRPCAIIFYGFLALYIVALLLLLVGTFGLFGAERDPLSGIFLLPLGLPWNRFLGGASEALLPWLAAAAPLVNLLLIRLVCTWLSGRGA